MKQFLAIARFELRYYLRRISTWVYFGIFLLLAFLLVNAIGGAWGSVQIAIGGSGGNVFVNSPYVLGSVSILLSLFGVLVTAALFGNSVFRDYEAGIHPLFFTTPLTRVSYLGGRFTGTFVVAAVIFASIPLGLMIGSVMPYLDAERFGPFLPAAFWQPYALVILPNLLFTGAIFFGLAAVTRAMLPNYIGGVLLLVGYLLAGNLAQDIENEEMAAMLDPFGLQAFGLVTKYWSAAEKNVLLLPLDGWIGWNRLLWIAVGLAVFAATFLAFRFSHQAPERRGRRRRASAGSAGQPSGALEPAYAAPRHLTIPAVERHWGFGAALRQYVAVARRSTAEILGNRYFFAILAAGLLFLVLSADQVGKLYGTTTWPVTYTVIDVLGGTFALFVLIIVTFYAGELVWRERDVHLEQVVDATPLAGWVPLASKFTALAAVIVVLQAVLLIAGVLTQAAKGYTNFEFGLYLRHLFGIQLVSYLLLAALVMLIHVLVNHKYLGHLAVVLYFVFSLFAGQLGIEHNLLVFGSGGGMIYSDMNGFGPFLEPFGWFSAYWAAWALLFAVLSNLFWVRGSETGARWRARLARLRFRAPGLAATAVAVTLILGLGGFIFYNTNVLNDFRTSTTTEQETVRYEREYKRFERAPQPRLVGVELEVDIYPAGQDARVRGTYRLVNKTYQPIDSLHVDLPRQIEIRSFEFSRPATEVLADAALGYRIFRLGSPLVPGDSLRLDFELAAETRGFRNAGANTQVVENGTFFNSSIMPSFGYNAGAELSDDAARRKYGLAPKPRAASINDLEARQNNYISGDADWIDFAATVSTVDDQIAIAPGYLQREWEEGGRRFFRYEMDAPILAFYSFLSARYEVRRDEWLAPDGRPVAIEIYYHPGHEYNLDRMADATKKSLAYFTENFGSYQHRQVRIIEFPRYASFAQSFPNTIPYSEAIGFIARVDDEDDIDYPFYITAHEVAHQWWAHQVIGGAVQGATVMSETLSQYSALMVMEQEYGREHMRRFLEYELDRYLTGRSLERKKEVPLLLDEGQGYIHYRKGSIAMYALRDYIGEDKLNAAIRAFLDKTRYQGPPYPTSRDLYAELREATPDSLHTVLADLFEHITLWDLRSEDATAEQLPDGRWRVTLRIEATKVRADSIGNEAAVEMNDPVDIGIFAAAAGGEDLGEPLYLEKRRIRSGEQTVQVIVDAEPARAGVDPYHKLIDRHTDDNVVKVGAPG